jgi:hypothetical protein
MRKVLAALGLSTALAAATSVPLATEARAAMNYGGQSVADLQHQIAPVEKAQFFFWGGNNWCWYPFGWRGPGWYWCGYEWDNGYGWGGPYGWNGWYVAPYYRSGNGWQWWHRHHHVPLVGQWLGHHRAPMMGAPTRHFAPMMGGTYHHRFTPMLGAPTYHFAPMMGGPIHHRFTPMMGAPTHHFAPMMGGRMPMLHGPGGHGPGGGFVIWPRGGRH